jgi:hypothetical protein
MVRSDRLVLGDYQYQVESMMSSREPFGDVEATIGRAELTDDQKAALWLLAWSLREPRMQRRDAEATLALVAG